MKGDPPKEKLNWTEIGILVDLNLLMNKSLLPLFLLLIFLGCLGIVRLRERILYRFRQDGRVFTGSAFICAKRPTGRFFI